MLYKEPLNQNAMDQTNSLVTNIRTDGHSLHTGHFFLLHKECLNRLESVCIILMSLILSLGQGDKHRTLKNSKNLKFSYRNTTHLLGHFTEHIKTAAAAHNHHHHSMTDQMSCVTTCVTTYIPLYKPQLSLVQWIPHCALSCTGPYILQSIFPFKGSNSHFHLIRQCPSCTCIAQDTSYYNFI